MKRIKEKITNLFTKNKPNKFIVSVDPATNNMSTFKVENGVAEQITPKLVQNVDGVLYDGNGNITASMKIAAQTIGLDLVAVKPAPMKQEDYDYLIEKHERNNMVITPTTDPSHPDYFKTTYEGPKTMKFTIPVSKITKEAGEKAAKTLGEMMNSYKENCDVDWDKVKLVSLNEPYTYTDTKEYKDSDGTINTLHDISNNQLADNHDDLISQMKRAKQRNEDVVNEIVAKHDALLDNLKKHKKK